MRFSDLTGSQRDLLAEAYREHTLQRLRALIAIPVCALISALAVWFFVLADGSGYGGYLGWPIVGVLGAVSGVMLLETLLDRGVRRIIRTFNLGPDASRALRMSLSREPALKAARRGAWSAAGGELGEGARRAGAGDWWGTQGPRSK